MWYAFWFVAGAVLMAVYLNNRNSKKVKDLEQQLADKVKQLAGKL